MSLTATGSTHPSTQLKNTQNHHRMYAALVGINILPWALRRYFYASLFHMRASVTFTVVEVAHWTSSTKICIWLSEKVSVGLLQRSMEYALLPVQLLSSRFEPTGVHFL